MDNKITLSVLAQMLSERTGRSRKECEDILRSFFQNISATLTTGEAVKVRGFGTFKISQVDARMSVDISSGQDFEIPAHNRIVFLPAKELAGAVNAPFGMFETIELADDLTDSELQASEELEKQKSDGQPYEAPISDHADVSESPATIDNPDRPDTVGDPEEADDSDVAEYAEVPENPDVSEEEDVSGDSKVAEAAEIPDNPDVEEYAEDAEDSVPEEEDQEDPEPERRRKSRFGHGFFWGMVAAIVIIAVGIFACYQLNDEFATHVDQLRGATPKTQVAQSVQQINKGGMAGEGIVTGAEVIGEIESGVDGMSEDVVTPVTPGGEDENPVPTKPSDSPVYDTIRPNTGLGVMARKYYGNYHFWPYIYKENEKILGHPDRITPGTRVVIPPLSKYGVDPKNAADIAKAKQLDVEIYNRYRKNNRPK